MKKFITLLLPMLGVCALTAQAQGAQERTQSAQQVIDCLVANGGHCQAVYYSASYQIDACHDKNENFTNNMWIKDSFGKAHFEQKNKDYIDWVDCDGAPGIKAKVVTLVDAFGGLFDWDFVISEDGTNNMSQYVDKLYQAKGDGNEHRYVRVHIMAPDEEDWFSKTPIPRTSAHDITDPWQLQLWLSQADIKNLEHLGVTPWGHTNFDESITLTPYWGLRQNFLRLAIKNDGVDGIRGTSDDVEETHYDFLYAEFRHYNPNTTIGDKLNGINREFQAIANFDEKTKEFSIYNFSDFGPSFTQPMGSGRGYGEGLTATISPIKGQLFSDGTLKIERQPGYVHYNRAYESTNDPYDCSITKWDDCWTAGVITDADGNYDPSNLQLKRDITGTWEGAMSFHHHMSNVENAASNPWVTDGGTCRTRENIKLHIDPYVYSTDAQLAQNLYDTDDTHGRGGIYELVTAQVDGDITLQLAIDNENEKLSTSLMKTTIERDGKNVEILACPVEFDVLANEQYVDHYEICVHERNGGSAVTDASDDAFENSSNLNDAMKNVQCRFIVKKGYNATTENGVTHYKAFTITGTDDEGKPIYTNLPTFELPAGKEVVTITFYIKAVYTEESGLAPTYHSLQNVHVSHSQIVTGIDDINVESAKTLKVLENGQVFIIKNGVKYNTMGQRVK